MKKSRILKRDYEAEAKEMSEIEYLYGVSKPVWKELSYVEALELKIKLADRILTSIMSTNYQLRDGARGNKLIADIKANRKALDE